MSDGKPRLNFLEKSTFVLGCIGAMIAFAVLILGDNVLKLAYKPDIYLTTDTVALESWGGSKEHIRLFDFYNSGTAASSNIKFVARFSTSDVKFKIESDEEVKNLPLKNSLVEFSLDRFSPRSHVRMSAISKVANPLIETYYIDDKGKTKIDPERRYDNADQWMRVAAIIACVLLIFWLAIAIMKRWEGRVARNSESATRELADKIDQLKSDVAELRGAFEEGARAASVPTGTENNGAVEVRLQNLLTPQVPSP